MSAPPGLSARRAAFGGRLTSDLPVSASNDHSGSTSTIPLAPAAPPAPAVTPRALPPHQQSQPSNRRAKGKGKPNPSQQQLVTSSPNPLLPKPKIQALDTGEEDDILCFLCAEVVQQDKGTYWALGECDHRTCQLCVLRLRCLYKRTDCTFCKHECNRVVITSSSTEPFTSFPPLSTPFSDTKLGLAFETREQMEDTLALLRFNCPISTCDSILSSWADLKRHTKSDHQLSLCDFCCSNKKIFTHEHETYTTEGLNGHMNAVHPYCGFCRIHFYDSDLLYAHCRDRHEECFICSRQGIRHQYHLNYDRLESHFKSTHFLCPHPECLGQKFVVFETELDLQAHAVAIHNAAFSGDQRARKEARRIETNFTYDETNGGAGDVGRGGSGGGGRGGRAARGGARNGGGGAGGGREGADFVLPTFENGHVPLGRRVVPGLGTARPERVGPQSSTGHDAPPHVVAATLHQVVEVPVVNPADALTLERHTALTRRVSEALGSESKVVSFKLAVRSYRGSEMSAGDFVDNLWNMFDRKIEIAGGIISSVADLFDDAEKREALLRAWHDVKVQQNQFPSLAPIGPALNGIPFIPHNTSQRALNSMSVRNQRDPSIWARVEQAALSSSSSSSRRTTTTPTVAPARERFPALPLNAVVGMKGRPSTSQRQTPWSASNSSSSSSRSTTPLPPSSSSATPISSSSFFPPPAAAAALFVETPRPSSSSSAAPTARSRPATGREFPSLPTSSIESDKRARMRQMLAKPSTSMITDPSPANSWGGSSSNGGRSGLSTRSGSPEPMNYNSYTTGNGGGAAVGGQPAKKKKPQKIILSMNASRGAN